MWLHRALATIPPLPSPAPGRAGGVLSLLSSKVEDHPHETALSVYENGFWRRVSYAEIRHRAERLSDYLMERGCGANERAAILADSGPEWGLAFFAIVRAGAIVLPLDTKLGVDELTGLLREAEPSVLFLSARFASTGQELRRRIASLALVILLADRGQGGLRSYQELEAATAHPAPFRDRHEVAVLTYTSGTTGRPKGVMTTFENLIFQVEALRQAGEPGSEDRVLSILPLHHLLELTAGFLGILWAGGEVCYVNSLLPDEILRAMRERRVTRMIAVPYFMVLLKRQIERRIASLPSWRRHAFTAAFYGLGWIRSRLLKSWLFRPLHQSVGGELRYFICGGAPLGSDVVDFFGRLGIPVYQGYGLTETSPVIATNTPRHHRRGSVGRPLAGVQVRIRGSATPGVGEIETKGLHVMKGYYRRPDLAEPFDLDGWLRTGDLGYLDRDGYLFVTGRLKDLIVLASGKKVAPDEVEQALRDSEAFREACVLGAALDPEKGEEVCAVVVPSEGLGRECGADLGKLRAAAGEEVARLVRRLASHKRPTRVLVREEALPRTAGSKVRREELRAWALATKPELP